MSTSCQPDNCVIRVFSDVEKPILFSDLAVKAATSENNNKKNVFNVREGSD